MDSTVLVTGSSGMIGTALVERLLNSGIDVHGVSRSSNPWSRAVEQCTIHTDLTDSPEALPADVDTIVHLAGISQVGTLIEDPSLAVANISMTNTVLKYAREKGANVLLASSREVYGDYDGTLRDEANADLRAVKNPYAASKAACESLVESYASSYHEVKTCILRFTNIYGPYDASSRVVPIFTSQAIKDKKITVYGDPMVRGYLYLEDCIAAIHRSIKKFDLVRGKVLNVGAGRAYSVTNIANQIVDSVDSTSEIVVEGQQDRTGDRYVLDISAIKSSLGWTPEYSLSEGIDQTVDWYLDHDEIVDKLA